MNTGEKSAENSVPSTAASYCACVLFPCLIMAMIIDLVAEEWGVQMQGVEEMTWAAHGGTHLECWHSGWPR